MPKTTSNETVEVEVRNRDGHLFTLESTNDQLERFLKENKRIQTLAFRQNGRMVRIIRDVKLKSRKDFYFTPELETAAIKNPLNRGTTFEYEDLDNSL